MNADTLIRALHQSPLMGFFVVTGGGASTVAGLLAVPGASRTVLEAVVPYAEDSLIRFLGHRPDSFCSAATAAEMARRAYDRAGQLVTGHPLVGVSCTASLATDRPKKGEHRAYIGIQTAAGGWVDSIILRKDARSRLEEEAVIQAIILNALAEVAGIGERLEAMLLPGEQVERETRTGDRWPEIVRGTVEWLCQEPDGRLRTSGSLPRVLMPGSFNPLHDGHCQLAEIAARRYGLPVGYELSITNVDKPALSVEVIRQRAAQFAEQAPLWLTRAPRFIEKARQFPGVIFVIGADTAVRLIDPRYYGDELQRDEALRFLDEQGCRFLVGGRFDERSGRFMAGNEISIPSPHQHIFDFLSESEFRIDLSSTRLRALPS